MWLVIACTMPVMIASGVVTISIHYYQSLSQSNAQNVLLPAVAWANDNWNCANIACTSTVQAGQPQPNYGCAEFVARALATEGFMPGLTSSSPQKSYDPYRPAGSKKDYDLLLIGHRTGLHTLADYLLDYGYAKNIGMDLREAKAGDAVVFSDLIYDKPAEEHVVLITTPGASPSSVKVAAHNNARYDNPLSNEINGFNGGWYILHIVYSNTSQL